MRPLIIQVPEGNGKDVLSFAEDVDAKNVCMWPCVNGEKKLDVVMAFVSNREVKTLLLPLIT